MHPSNDVTARSEKKPQNAQKPSQSGSKPSIRRVMEDEERADVGAQDTLGASSAGGDSGSGDRFESFLAALASSPPPYRPPTLAPDDVFAGRYRVERELGRGGMGTVYLTTDLELGRKVALKLALGRRAETELERLQQEATVMAGLSHPGIVTVFEAAASGEDVYITLEFVPGGTLRDWIDLRAHGWRDAVSMFISMAEALSAAHEAGVVHRDFKPANVLLDLEGRPRIADFGLARSEGPLDTQEIRLLRSSTTTRTGAVIGTPAYMAPEQAQGDPATPAADQFAFFVSLFESICGVRPFDGNTLLDLINRIEAGPPDAYPGMPRSLIGVVQRGLEADPAKRYPSMDVVARELRRVLHQRRRRLQWAGLTLGVLAATAIGYAAAPEAQPPCQRKDLAASIESVWTQSARATLQSSAGGQALERLSRYKEDVVDQRVAACEAHTLRSDLSDVDFALRTACLDRAEARFAGLVDDLLASPRDVADVGDLLPAPKKCTDTVALRRYANALASKSSLDDATQDAANVRAIRLLTRAKLRALRGEDFETLTQEVIELADANGLAGIEAEALLLLASAEESPAEATALLDRAVAAAGEEPAPEFLADVAEKRGSLAVLNDEYAQASVHLDYAEVLARLGVAPVTQDQLERDLLRQQIASATGDTKGSIEELRRLIAEFPEGDAHHRFARGLLADVLQDRNRFGEAVALYDELLAEPETADPFDRLRTHINRAVSLRRMGRAREAAAAVEAGREAYAEPLAPGIEGSVQITEGAIAMLDGEFERAEARFSRAAKLLGSVDPQHPLLGNVAYHQARLALKNGEHRAALDRINDALAVWDRINGPGSADAGRALVVMSDALVPLGHSDEAARAAKVAAGFLREHDRPEDEIALAELAEARASGEENPAARKVCEASELALCREALQGAAANALSP